MFPEGFIIRIKQQEYIDTDNLLQSLAEPAPVSIRINRSKTNGDPSDSDPVDWCDSGFYLAGRPSFTLDPLFHAGCYYVQEASGMFLGEVYRQTLGDMNEIRVLDLCGAPGGKSTHLSSLIGQKGLLIANETIVSRAAILTENITKWGLSNTIVTQNDPSAFKSLPGFFDMVLVDAPCSGEGMFRDKSVQDQWSEKNTALCAERQKRILMDVWPSIKENGILAYTTCTFNPGENEDNIRWLISRKRGETVKLDISGYKGIAEIDFNGVWGYGFYPGKIRGEGLFVSVLRKKEKEAKADNRQRRPGYTGLTGQERSVAAEWTLFPSGGLIRSGDSMFYTAGGYETLHELSGWLRIKSPGTRIFTIKKNKFIPSHDLALSVFIKKNHFPVMELDPDSAIRFLRRENFTAGNSEQGWNLISFRGVNLGFANNIGNRLNNYYPVEWRIRMRDDGRYAPDPVKWSNISKT
ncbi:MAG: rRNA cytosine-C5-methyltransferase [Bacteroidales bacterium]